MGDSLLRKALGWLAHPVSLAAIVVMALNDHVLKAAFGGWWTGKLSDVAGLVFFPALVAVVLAAVGVAVRGAGIGGARPAGGDFSRLALGAVAVTGAGFVWVKATWAGAATASAVLTAITGPFVGGPSVVRADVTDLLALPALGLAAWVATGAARGDRYFLARGVGTRHVNKPRADRRSRTRRALGVALVPVAILASVATGPGPRPEASVVDDGQGGWVVLTWNPARDAYRLTADGWQPALTPGEPSVPVPMACSVVETDWCFRTVPGELAVEQSSDGGATWKTSWAASADDLRALRDAYGARGYGQEVDLQSSGVGVFDGADGMTVVVGNQVDGLLVRGPDGHWERVAFEGLSCCDGWGFVPLPTRWMPYGAAMPPAIAWGSAALLLAGTFTILVADRRVRRASGGVVTSRERWAWGWTLAGSAVAALAAIVMGPVGSTSWSDLYAFDTLGLTALLLVPAALIVAAIAFTSAGGSVRRVWWRMWIAALAVAVVVGAAVFAVPGADWWDLLVAAAVSVAGVWFAGRVVAARGEAWGISPLVDPPPWAPVNPLGSDAVLPGTATKAGPDAGDRGADNLDDPDTAEWTRADALVLQCVGRTSGAKPLLWVLAEVDYLDHSYPSVAQLEVSLGTLEASGLVKVVRHGWFRATREGRAVLRQGRRLAAAPGSNLRGAIVEALRELPCVKGRVRIGQEAYDEAMRRYLGR